MIAAWIDRLAERLSADNDDGGRLARAAVVASAFAVAPLAYIARPQSARELVRRTCSDCPAGSRCCAGYTAFCCTLPEGNNYACPDDTFVAGWWQCNYGGHGLCGTTNRRYYVDCNTRPHHTCRGGCHCADDDCNNFHTCCTHFRYGQCNTQIGGTGTIKCRLVTCIIPCRIECMNCSCSSAVDQITCGHNAGCL